MLIIQDVLISDDIIDEEFICDISACKGGCCWKGDYGAPVSTDEEKSILSHLDKIKENLSLESNALIDNKNPFDIFTSENWRGTSLHKDGSCVFMIFDKNGTAKCGIEKTFEAGTIDFQKPMSCHLYPIRVTINKEAEFEAWNYDLWDICSAACDLGKKESVPVYQFLKDPIIKYKGIEFYNELDSAVSFINQNKKCD